VKESVIQKKILDYLDAKGCYAVKVMTANKSGVADIICCNQGRFIALEVKSDKGIVSEMQKFNAAMVRRAGGKSEIVKSVDDVRKVIDAN
jgi:Holliday junction resolvase